MANKNDNYYLINGDQTDSRTIYIPYKGTYYKNVKDISDMDLATIELGTNLRPALEDANRIQKLDSLLYVGKYPYAKGIKIFKPVEIFKENPSISNIVGNFRDLAEERNYNYHNGNSVELTSKDKIARIASAILVNLTDTQRRIMFEKNSILGKEVKSNYFHNKYLFDTQIANYTQLRNLLINYLYIKAGKSTPTNYDLKNMSEFMNNINGLSQENPDDIKRALIEYKEALIKAKDEEELRLAEEAYIRKTHESFTQMTLFDAFPELMKK